MLAGVGAQDTPEEFDESFGALLEYGMDQKPRSAWIKRSEEGSFMIDTGGRNLTWRPAEVPARCDVGVEVDVGLVTIQQNVQAGIDCHPFFTAANWRLNRRVSLGSCLCFRSSLGLRKA